MKRIVFALILSLSAGAAGAAFACDCEHKKQEAACKKGNCKNCTGSCNPNNQKPDSAKPDTEKPDTKK